jgi:proline dehydrogenase
MRHPSASAGGATVLSPARSEAECRETEALTTAGEPRRGDCVRTRVMKLLRTALLKASQSTRLRESLPRHRFARRTVERFMPGESADDALAAAQRLEQNGMGTILSHLGENVADHAEAEGVTRHYLDVLEKIRGRGLRSELSIKLTQLGFDLDPAFCLDNFLRIAAQVPSEKTLWIDMEQSPYVDPILGFARRAHKTAPNVGVCVQAYLFRTERDIEALIAEGAAVRLVKGAYSEPPEIAFAKKADVDENYFRLARMLLEADARRAGVRAAIGTHDRRLIARICEWAGAQGMARGDLEFQMLYGIQSAEGLRLAREGYRSGVFICYGSYWFPWFMRRLAERPANVLFLARNLFSVGG